MEVNRLYIFYLQKREVLGIMYVYYRIAGFPDGGGLEDLCQRVARAHTQYVRIKEYVTFRWQTRLYA